jgi:hypothetical protein
VDLGSIWSGFGVDLGSIWSGFGVDLGSISVDLGWIWSGFLWIRGEFGGLDGRAMG